ncbi:MAG: S-layer homology domain-containing protein, partial [Oscillospiraceae bacterium]|nr:S-layer homology domain-containing protein [Oscillospiraceae bacterium]
MKKLISALLALIMCLSCVCGSALAADRLEDYLDLDPDMWYAQGVRYCLEHGLMQGYGNRMRYFEPDKPMTRAQLVTTLWRMSGEPVTGLSMQYRDVPDDKWYTEAVRWALAEDVMTGVSATLFAPDDVLTREQLVVSLWSYAKYINGFVPELPGRELEKYRDSGDINESSLPAMR